MEIPLSEFIRIRKNTMNSEALESAVRDAVRNLLTFTTQTGNVTEIDLETNAGNNVDAIYSDNFGAKIALTVVVNKDRSKAQAKISDAARSLNLVDKLVVLTNTGTAVGENGTTVVNIDSGKIIDLMYFNDKFNNEELLNDDLQRAVVLAKSMKLW
jgi:sporulation protein YlmC with PRC-barrel domain